jgi:hypothetical protein
MDQKWLGPLLQHELISQPNMRHNSTLNRGL